MDIKQKLVKKLVAPPSVDPCFEGCFENKAELRSTVKTEQHSFIPTIGDDVSNVNKYTFKFDKRDDGGYYLFGRAKMVVSLHATKANGTALDEYDAGTAATHVALKNGLQHLFSSVRLRAKSGGDLIHDYSNDNKVLNMVECVENMASPFDRYERYMSNLHSYLDTAGTSDGGADGNAGFVSRCEVLTAGTAADPLKFEFSPYVSFFKDTSHVSHGDFQLELTRAADDEILELGDGNVATFKVIISKIELRVDVIYPSPAYEEKYKFTDRITKVDAIEYSLRNYSHWQEQVAAGATRKTYNIGFQRRPTRLFILMHPTGTKNTSLSFPTCLKRLQVSMSRYDFNFPRGNERMIDLDSDHLKGEHMMYLYNEFIRTMGCEEDSATLTFEDFKSHYFYIIVDMTQEICPVATYENEPGEFTLTADWTNIPAGGLDLHVIQEYDDWGYYDQNNTYISF